MKNEPLSGLVPSRRKFRRSSRNESPNKLVDTAHKKSQIEYAQPANKRVCLSPLRNILSSTYQ